MESGNADLKFCAALTRMVASTIKVSTMKALILLLMATVALKADEINTAPPPVSVTTNYVKAHRFFRRVDGKLYNIQKSVLWRDITGICAKVMTNGIVVRTFVEKTERYRLPSADSGTSISNILAGGRPAEPAVQTRMWQEEGPTVFLVNYDGPEPVFGKVIRVKAMKVGTEIVAAEVIEKWDCGTPNMVAVIVTNPPALHPKPQGQSTKPTTGDQ